MLNHIKLALGGILLGLTSGCGQSVERPMRDFAAIYGELASILERINDMQSAEAAKKPIQALSPRMLAAGRALATRTSRPKVGKDLSMEVLMACDREQRRFAGQVKRLRGDPALWDVIQPALQKTMVLQAMPPR